MEHNHMLVPTSARDNASTNDAVFGQHQPLPRPPPTMMPYSPPAYSLKPDASLTLSSIRFADIPTTELPPPLAQPNRGDHDVKLPSLSTITGGHGHGIPRGDVLMNAPHWPSHNTLPYHTAGHQPLPSIDSPARMDLDTSSNSAVSAASAASPDRFLDARSSSVSLDDPDVRLAAEALGDLRADFVSSPPNRNSSLPLSPAMSHAFQQNGQHSHQPVQPEPLLSLLTTSHPLLASTIEGATSAYGGAKNYSPRFRSGAEYVEGYITPIANTVGSVSRVTGVEGGVRWFLGAGRRHPSSSSDVETGNGKKRRKADTGGPISNKRLEGEGMKQIGGPHQLNGEAGTQQDMFSPTSKAGSRRMSVASTVDTLPAYDEMRSPAYTETVDGQNSPRRTGTPNRGAWQSRLIMSTSGLSVAMSEESLRSLKYCLRWLRWANDHISHITGTLKTTLEEYEQADGQSDQAQNSEKAQMDGSQAENAQGPSRVDLAVRINSLKGDVLKTLKDVIDTVSKYAGGALPENARILVRRHLTSLPQRFRVAAMSERSENADRDSDSALREGAQKVLVLAKEGLDMVAQVSGVLDGTIVSAEEWCDRMGKRRKDQDEKPVLPQIESSGDVKMG